MTFDQWIDEVNMRLKARLGEKIRTEELSWDSAMWVGPAGTAVASVADDDVNAKLWIDGQARQEFAFRDAGANPEIVSETIARHLASR
jgi:hypothetical protein